MDLMSCEGVFKYKEKHGSALCVKWGDCRKYAIKDSKPAGRLDGIGYSYSCAFKILGAYFDGEVGDWGDTKYPLNHRTSELP